MFWLLRGVGVRFGFVRSALLHAVGACDVLSFEAVPGLCCFLCVTPTLKKHPACKAQKRMITNMSGRATGAHPHAPATRHTQHHTQSKGGFECAIVSVVLGDAKTLLLSLCNSGSVS